MAKLDLPERIFMLKSALFINLIIVICELYTLGHIRGKRNILKYYTYLQNFLTLIVSIIFSIFLIVNMVSGRTIPEFVKGLRYVTTCGLVAAMFIFIAFLGTGKKIAMTHDDFLSGLSPQKANAVLHFICPILSLVSFIFGEKEINLSNGIWTSLAAVPSCIYWVTYIALSVTKLWKEPYDFDLQGEKSTVHTILSVLLIPLSFVAISFVLWYVK